MFGLSLAARSHAARSIAARSFAARSLAALAIGLTLSGPAFAGDPERIPAPRGLQPPARPQRALRGIPDVIQANEYSCGPGAVQAILTYYGVWGYQDDFAKEMGTSAEQGTHPARMAAYLDKWGLRARLREGLSIRDLRRYVDRGVPVIVDFQAWGQAGKDYRNEWEDGHYCIVVGYDRRGLFLEDPSLLGTLGYLTDREFERRWRDYEIEEGKRRPYVRLGIVVEGERRLQPPVSPID